MIKFNQDIMNMALNRMPDREIVVLCSSGVDSIAAAHFYHKKCQPKNSLLSLLHFNHQLRPQNDLMAESYTRFVEDTSHDICGYPPINIADLGRNITDRTEDGLRKARLKAMEKHYTKTIFITAHHLDDCVTSYLLNVLRGKEGYLPIPFITEIGSNILVHPFLFTEKADFIQYAERNDLMKFVVNDETNDEIRGSRRNFIRKDIVPLLEREKMGLRKIVKKKIEQRLMLDIIKG